MHVSEYIKKQCLKFIGFSNELIYIKKFDQAKHKNTTGMG